MNRDYDYPIDDVWSAWTEPERMARWIGEPHGELTLGGRCRLVMAPPEGDVVDLHIRSCSVPSELIVIWRPRWDDSEPESRVQLTLEPLADQRTRLTLVHQQLGPDDAAGYGAGWEEFLALLQAILSGRTSDDPGYDRKGLEQGATPLWRRLVDQT